MQREHWGSRIGFILAAAGSAVGLGNIWKFPYLVGAEGGGAFLVVYVAFLIAIGVCVMIAEIALGRQAQSNPFGAFKRAAGGGWSIFGLLAVLTAFLILSFYSVVGGWTVAYIVKTVSGGFSGYTGAEFEKQFGALVSSAIEPIVYHGAFMAIGVLIVIRGISGGIEKASKIMMPLLFILLALLVVRSLTLPGAMAGVKYFLVPDWSHLDADMVSAALGQAFFTLSLGMGALITYGSYLGKKESIPNAAMWVVGLDLLVAVLAGFLILPAVFAFNMDPAAGPGLTFITLPAIFAELPFGMFIQLCFFVLLFVAAITSAISLLQVVVAFVCEEFNVGRKSATIWVGLVTFLFGVPSSLALGIWGEFTLFGMNFFELLGFITDNYFLPLGGVATCLVAGWVSYDKFVNEITNEGERPFTYLTAWKWMCRVVAPIAIIYVMLHATFDV
ncbi:Sodium:neurotransmitter symporter family protein [Pseudovibrio axinellae]|uniref:Sodium:neurotransmitter symporter family protein n=1 Tax=Pseudovibrio axinellae TaxID=989403 RepID=A0A166AK84_9HYPH|nr:sodium-dependent transporter [Pseudovibrio axinellae]KZL21225.1 Sodium:neurotransmitter symporter family protein [Pseudovibrio axinellae]SEQ92636.1 neurotransmitter:Na+ symporter, NSS family [Pseudovibrio axinellae]